MGDQISDPREMRGEHVLEKLVNLPVSTWRYHWEDESTRHLGPMAQDFAAAFGLGDNDTTIALVDGLGVLMVGVQALHRQMEGLARRIENIERAIHDHRDPELGAGERP